MAATKSAYQRNSAAYWLYLMPGLIGFLLVVGIPFLMNIGISFTKWRGINMPTFIGLASYNFV